MRVFLAGATGVLGRRLLPRLVAGGHHVVALTRRPEAAAGLAAAGAEPAVADVFDEAALGRAVAAARPEVVVHQLTALPARIDPRRVARDLAPTNRLRDEGTRRLLAAARAAGARRFVAQSIAFVGAPAAPGAPALLDEAEPVWAGHPAFAPVLAAVASLERQVVDEAAAHGDLEGVALRYGFFWGPGTVYAEGGAFRADVLRRRVPVVGGGGGVFSFVHVDDAAEATVLAVEGRATGRLHVVDDAPRPVAAWLPEYAARLGAPRPWRVPRWLGRLGGGPYGVHLLCDQRGASNARAREALGWRPARTAGAPG